MTQLPDDAFPNTVYVDRTPDGVTPMGGTTGEQTQGDVFAASVQAKAGGGRDDRNVGGGAIEARSKTMVNVLFPVDPQVIENNTIRWPDGNMVLNVLGTASDASGGYGVCWQVSCEQVN